MYSIPRTELKNQVPHAPCNQNFTSEAVFSEFDLYEHAVFSYVSFKGVCNYAVDTWADKLPMGKRKLQFVLKLLVEAGILEKFQVEGYKSFAYKVANAKNWCGVKTFLELRKWAYSNCKTNSKKFNSKGESEGCIADEGSESQDAPNRSNRLNTNNINKNIRSRSLESTPKECERSNESNRSNKEVSTNTQSSTTGKKVKQASWQKRLKAYLMTAWNQVSVNRSLQQAKADLLKRLTKWDGWLNTISQFVQNEALLEVNALIDWFFQNSPELALEGQAVASNQVVNQERLTRQGTTSVKSEPKSKPVVQPPSSSKSQDKKPMPCFADPKMYEMRSFGQPYMQTPVPTKPERREAPRLYTKEEMIANGTWKEPDYSQIPF